MNHSSHLSACDLSHFLKTKLKLEDQRFDSREAVEHPSQREEYKNTQQDCRKQSRAAREDHHECESEQIYISYVFMDVSYWTF